jgi:hypothetical protein
MTVGLIVVIDGKENSGDVIGAGDVVERTEYDHGRRVITLYVGRPRFWRTTWRLFVDWVNKRGAYSR